MLRRNHSGVVVDYDSFSHQYIPRRATKKYFEESKKHRLVSKRSRRLNRKH